MAARIWLVMYADTLRPSATVREVLEVSSRPTLAVAGLDGALGRVVGAPKRPRVSRALKPRSQVVMLLALAIFSSSAICKTVAFDISFPSRSSFAVILSSSSKGAPRLAAVISQRKNFPRTKTPLSSSRSTCGTATTVSSILELGLAKQDTTPRSFRIPSGIRANPTASASTACAIEAVAGSASRGTTLIKETRRSRFVASQRSDVSTFSAGVPVFGAVGRAVWKMVLASARGVGSTPSACSKRTDAMANAPKKDGFKSVPNAGDETQEALSSAATQRPKSGTVKTALAK
mmetsp:Transcript_15630/g.59411  ORF Transcript_15630/g.59411 Transcript_15630/m.59411 type:complete len:290 (+) Transcript_15630:1110-1979(+)